MKRFYTVLNCVCQFVVKTAVSAPCSIVRLDLHLLMHYFYIPCHFEQTYSMYLCIAYKLLDMV